MSGGRVELGLGAGWYDAEHTAYGFAFPPLGERFERLEEQFAILTGLWTTPVGETFDFEGRHYHLKDSPALPKPAQQPHPPLIVGGGGAKRTPRLAATYADEFNLPFSSLADTEAQYGRVRAACETRGRDPKTLRLSAAQVRLLRVETRRRSSGAPATSGASPTSSGRTGRPARPTRSWPASRPLPASGPRPCTSRCSTSTTSNTSSCWPRRSSPGSPDRSPYRHAPRGSGRAADARALPLNHAGMARRISRRVRRQQHR